MGFLAPVFLALSLLFSPNSTFAKEQDSSSSGRGNSNRDRLEEKRTKFDTRMATKEATAAKVREMRTENINKYGLKMVEKLEAMVRRLEKLIARIESRLEKIETAGKDISEIVSQVDEAKNKLSQTQTNITNLKNQIDAMADSDNPKEQFANIRASVKDIINELKEVHRMLVHVIGSIKGLRVGEDKMSPSPSASP